MLYTDIPGFHIEENDFYKIYFLDGKVHREDGPAIDDNDGTKGWYLRDKRINCITQEEFERLMRLKAFW